MNHCAVTADLNRHLDALDSAGRRELAIEQRATEIATELLCTACAVFDRSSVHCDAATIENDVEPLLCDVISAHDFDVMSAKVMFALARQFHAEKCAPEQQAADMELVSQFAQIGKQAIELAAKQIAEREYSNGR